MPRLLMVEDQAAYATLMRHWIRHCIPEAAVEQVSTLADALEKVSRQHFDLILFDLTLPDTTFGSLLSVSQIVKAADPTPIAVITGGMPAWSEEVYQRGGHCYLLKAHLEMEEFCQTIRNILQVSQVGEEVDTHGHGE